MVEESEAVSLIYGLLHGLKAYREAYSILNNKGQESTEITLEEVIDKYKKFEQLLSFLVKMVG